MRLADYLEPELVILDLRTEGVGPTIRAFVERLQESGRIQDPDTVAAALEGREASHSTSLGNGVALPHSTVAGIDAPVLLLARAPAGIFFGPGDEQVRLFFVLLSPQEQAGTHIKLLARIVRLVRRADFVSSVMETETAADMVDAVEHFDASHS